jgi:hypothetical protein
MKLIYIGRGALVHVPPRDLTEQDFAERAEVWSENGITEASLLASGLYKKAEQEQPKKSKRATSAEEGE